MVVCVPQDRAKRSALLTASGQASVPALVDGSTVLTTTDGIISYLKSRSKP